MQSTCTRHHPRHLLLHGPDRLAQFTVTDFFFSFFFFNLERGGRSPQRHLVPAGDRAEASERKKEKRKKSSI